MQSISNLNCQMGMNVWMNITCLGETSPCGTAQELGGGRVGVGGAAPYLPAWDWLWVPEHFFSVEA